METLLIEAEDALFVAFGDELEDGLEGLLDVIDFRHLCPFFGSPQFLHLYGRIARKPIARARREKKFKKKN